MKPTKPLIFILIKDNFGLKTGTKFYYFECPNLYMPMMTQNGVFAGDSRYRFTPEMMVERYFKVIKSKKEVDLPS